MTALTVVAPADMPALQALMAAHTEPLHFLAGGTDMLVAGRELPAGGVLVDVSRIAGLAGVETQGADIRIGAATTVAALAEHQGLRTRLPALCEAASQCGSVQIRNRATMGGNIANGAPSADLVPVLLAAEARLVLLEPGGRSREVAVADYRRLPGELIVEVILPAGGLRSHSAFAKLGRRRDLTISRLSLALIADMQDGCLGAPRLTAGAIGPWPRRLPLAEAALAGRRLEAATLRDFVAALTAEVDRAIPGRASQLYKRRAIAGVGLDLIAGLTGLGPRDRLFEEALG
jgi:carbon-monoxide dehydrogenase medium subunit